MYQYTVIQWLFFFYLYSFIGWCYESVFVSVQLRHPVNRGFMRGPFLPIYGCAALMMLFVSAPFSENLFLTYIAGCIGATVLELVTGVFMEKLFKIRYWDYTNYKINFKGYIALIPSLTWGLLTIFMTRFLHKYVEMLALGIPGDIIAGITYVISVIFIVDFTLSFKAALDLKDVLAGMENARDEMVRIKRRLDVVIALVNDDVSNRKKELQEISDGFGMRMDELKSGIEDRFEELRDDISKTPGLFSEKQREELRDLAAKYRVSLAERTRLGTPEGFSQKNIIRSNPSMRSEKYKEAFEELKGRLGNNNKNNNKKKDKSDEV